MAKSGRADSGSGSVPRWIILLPLAISFVSLAVQVSGADFHDGVGVWRRPVWSAFTWVGAVFPHPLIFPLLTATPAGSVGAMAVIASLDGAIVWLVLRTQFRRLSLARLGVVAAIWTGLTVISVFAAPGLMVAAWKAFH